MIPGSIHEMTIVSASEEHPRNTEAAMIDLADGSILLAWSRFVKGGTDWSSTGDLLVIWNNVFNPIGGHFGARTPLTAAISDDDGKSWSRIRNIEEEPEFAYSYTSIHFRGDEVLLTYYRIAGDESERGLKLTILPVSWFYENSYNQR